MTCPTCRQPLPRPVCRCGHSQAAHNLVRRSGVYLNRGWCSVMTGPSGIPCGCVAWQPEEREAM